MCSVLSIGTLWTYRGESVIKLMYGIKPPAFRFLFYKNKADPRSRICILSENTALTCNIPQSLGGAEQQVGPLIPHTGTLGSITGGTPQITHNPRAAGPAPPAPHQGPTRFSGRDDPRAPRARVDSPVRGTLRASRCQLTSSSSPVPLFPLFACH